MQVVPGPITGIPEVTSCQSDHLPFKTTLCFLPLQPPCASNFFISFTFGTFSNALPKSRYIISIVIIKHLSNLFKELKEVCGTGFVAEKPKLGIFYQAFIYRVIDKLVFNNCLKNHFVFLSSKVLLLNVLLKFISRTDTADQSLIHFHRD